MQLDRTGGGRIHAESYPDILMKEICDSCSYAKCDGRCICRGDPANPVPIEQHIAANKCPLDFFRTRALEQQLIEAGVPVRKPANEPGGCGC